MANSHWSSNEIRAKPTRALAFFRVAQATVFSFSPVEAVFALRESAREQPGGPPPKASLAHNTAVLRIKLIGANPEADISGEDELSARSNYFIGKDHTAWRRDVPQ